MNVFDSLIGQNQAIELLTCAVNQNRIAPAYLFAGPSGVGRSLGAKCFAKLLMGMNLSEAAKPLIEKKLNKGNHPDLFWVQPTYLHQGQRLSATEAAAAGVKRKAPPQIRIEQVREITQFLSRPPLEAARAVVVIEEAQTMAESAANALLKTLEEPGQATLILIAPSADSLLPTLVSRCQRIPFYALAMDTMQQVLKVQGYQEILEDEALLLIAQGSPGEAIYAWEQLKSIPDELLWQVTQLLVSSLQGMQLGKEIAQKLELSSQLWLLDYLQYFYWQKKKDSRIPKHLEKARQYLLSYVQPRLVWETTLINIFNNYSS